MYLPHVGLSQMDERGGSSSDFNSKSKEMGLDVWINHLKRRCTLGGRREAAFNTLSLFIRQLDFPLLLLQYYANMFAFIHVQREALLPLLGSCLYAEFLAQQRSVMRCMLNMSKYSIWKSLLTFTKMEHQLYMSERKNMDTCLRRLKQELVCHLIWVFWLYNVCFLFLLQLLFWYPILVYAFRCSVFWTF